VRDDTGTKYFMDDFTKSDLMEKRWRFFIATELPAALTALLAVADQRAGSIVSRQPGRPKGTADFPRRFLFTALRNAFVVVHGFPPRVITRTHQGLRSHQPDGPAMEWHASLLNQAAGRSSATALHDLAQWARQPDALAHAIRGAAAEENGKSLSN
jgi:hypothetical protein